MTCTASRSLYRLLVTWLGRSTIDAPSLHQNQGENPPVLLLSLSLEREESFLICAIDDQLLWVHSEIQDILPLLFNTLAMGAGFAQPPQLPR